MKKIILFIFLFSFIALSMPALAATNNNQDKALNKKLTQIRTKQLATINKIHKNKSASELTVNKTMKTAISKKNKKK